MLVGSRGGRDNANRPRGWYSGRGGEMEDNHRLGDSRTLPIRGDNFEKFDFEIEEEEASF
jgi:hypothetical protein